MLDEAGNATVFNLRKYKCSGCGAIHTEVPDIMIGRKHYSAEVYKKVKSGECDYFAGDDSTIRRWKKE